ncbi:MAG: pyridoxal-phosphate dependent enzyme [Planctomycetota bacterium]|jgi:cystathionine beta-synthase
MDIKKDILEAVGNTPLVKLNKLVDGDCATVLAKCEFLNPAGSVKDRMALHIIEEAERRGDLRPGGTIVENTSGNTGLGVAMAAAVRGYQCVFTMPDKMSVEKVNMLKAFGAEVVITPTDVPGDSPEHYVNVAKRISEERSGSFYVDQYHNPINIEAHYRLTGPEIWEQTEGRFDAFVAGAGTGGTISGVGRFIKERSDGIRVVGVDPIGSVHYHYFYTGTLPTPHVYKVEGIGEDIRCGAFDPDAIDEMRQVNDKESFLVGRSLVREEGLFCGGSSGSAVHVAVEVAREMGPGKTVVVVLPDSGTRYVTKYLSDTWMKDHGFLETAPDLGLVEDLLRGATQEVIVAREEDPVDAVIRLMRDHGVSQIPVVSRTGRPVSIVTEVDVLRALHTNGVEQESPVREVAQEVGGLIYPKARVEELFHIFESDQTAIVVDEERVVGIVSKIDMIEFLAKARGARE